jgi:predicted CXXCH cytochrome family protein
MRILSFLVLCLFLVAFNQETRSPHGKDFKVSCNNCHSAKGWQLDKSVYSFDHGKTSFALTGQHVSINCRQCHPSLVFSEAKNECNECHKDIHQSTTGSDCSRCHNSGSWLVSNITRIHEASRFPLLGAHKLADCADCHKSENLARFDVPGINCIDCHRSDYMATKDPDHRQSGISEDCAQCHLSNAATWSNVKFNHSIFPLVQGHSALKCSQCHTSGNFKGLSTDCYSCHQQDFQGTTNPNHVQASFPTTCFNCHTLSRGWKPAAFDHSSFPLTLGHSIPACIDCHKGGSYTALSTDCYSCHQPEYTSTTNPNHIAAGIPTVCLTCHTTNPGWQPANFNHGAFPLTLGHASVTCADCHKGNYTNTSAECYSCHSQNYTATTNPNHLAAGFPQTCQACHTTNPGWSPASFNHTGFPLTLGHSGVACADCHKGGNYTSISTDCYSCHSANYSGTTNPNHQSLAFSTTCTLCHTTNPGWKPATYTLHDSQFFPIYSGRHKGAWTVCSDCHTDASNFTLFDCKRCHSDAHRNQNYTNNQCYSCHPTGQSE